MEATPWKEGYTERAEQIWEEYQRTHDVSELAGKTAGIDPKSGRVWFGESALDIVERLEQEGLDAPLYFVRVGSSYYLRKGRRA
jgi:hypothetical protein